MCGVDTCYVDIMCYVNMCYVDMYHVDMCYVNMCGLDKREGYSRKNKQKCEETAMGRCRRRR